MFLWTILFSSFEEGENFQFLRQHDQNSNLDSQKVQLGRMLFFDKRLSLDNSVSCASCHIPGKAFCDNLETAVGINGLKNTRNTPSLLNADSLSSMMFDAHIKTLERQVIVPIQESSEMGNNMKFLIPKLRKVSYYQEKAKKIFNRDFDAFVLTRSIAAFERTLRSRNSRYDQYINGDKKALSKNEKKGMTLFLNKLHCSSCHPPPNFTTYKAENNGLTNDYASDQGRFRVTKDSSDIGKFKIPSLRNIGLTFPYMHNGSFLSLDSIIEKYAFGGNSHPNKSAIITPFKLDSEEKQNLIEFLLALSDTTNLSQFTE